MISKILKNMIKQRLEKIELGDNDVVVLKGIPLSLLVDDVQPINLEDICEDKISYLFMNIHKKRQFLCYEEFLLLSNLVIQQYKNVYVLNNNLYINQYPLDCVFSDSVRNGLINHFIESEIDDDRDIGDINEILRIYSTVNEYNDFLVGAYYEGPELDDTKVSIINLFPESEYILPSVDVDLVESYIEIKNEYDYIRFIKNITYKANDVFIRVSNYEFDVDQLKDHIRILAENLEGYTNISLVHIFEKDTFFEHREEYTDILKKHWGYNKFRYFSIYDLSKLEQGKKEIFKVSQEQIISDLVHQVENCMDSKKEFRDVFVTAPTGAGKSAIFQIPAIYLAEKYNLLTIVISPLIGLMNDQVKNLEVKNYTAAKTINSDISPIIKEEIINKVSNDKYHILYISPETLLSRGDVEQLIGKRTIGMIIIDEAHIVTTWGKQFRPDYWYLGDHIKKLRANQQKTKGQAFVIGTFTATAIYKGIEDMYEETRNSLHMIDPLTYLGYVRRNDIDIRIEHNKKVKGIRNEYEINKYDEIIELIKRVKITGKKTLIYFPTVQLIERCMEYLYSNHVAESVTMYYGPLPKDRKLEAYETFMSSGKMIMLATKAFGMGIDIDDIEIVAHFAPTGNVCDYVQEIGRAARNENLLGEAYYSYNTRDFKHINRLHGLSTIKKYQLIEVVKKINELYKLHLKNTSGNTKKRNAMLVDAENFTYIFNSPLGEDNNINKVKTALLIIQKDYENRFSFSPIAVKPIPLFAWGFFAIETSTQKIINKKYGNPIEEIDSVKHICRVKLDKIWNSEFRDLSFPQFKFLLYTQDDKLMNRFPYTLTPSMSISINFTDGYKSIYKKTIDCLRKIAHDSKLQSKYVEFDEIVSTLVEKTGISKYKAQAICEVYLASIDSYRKNFSRTQASLIAVKNLQNGLSKYMFNSAMNTYFGWLERGFKFITTETKNGQLYIVNSVSKETKQFSAILGILEAIDVLSFEMIGGANSQLYIYVNQIRHLKNIVNNPGGYKNRLLDMVDERHLISAKMLTYIYEGGFSSEEIWDIIEDYFLGKIPNKVKIECKKDKPNIVFPD